MFPGWRSRTRAERLAFFALVAFLSIVSVCHLVYVLSSHMVPSADEAHYLGGSHLIAQGIRSGSLQGMWTGYVTALGFKSPLICVPAAFSMLLWGDNYTSALLAQIPILFLLGLSTNSLFRNALSSLEASVGACLLVTMPMVTGLTHRFYTENLVLLCTTIYLDLLIRHGWSGFRSSTVLGMVLGLGALAKLTFLPLLLLPSAYVFAITTWKTMQQPKWHVALFVLAARILVFLVIAGAVGATWYARNWEATYQHSQRSYSSYACAYPAVGSFLTNLSSGPHALLLLPALIGLAMLFRLSAWRDMSARQRHVWIVLLLLALVSTWLTTSSINKAVRFSEPWLLLVAGLIVLPLAWLRVQPRRARSVGLAFIAVSLLLFLHNSFRILPVAPVRLGDFRVLDSHFPLNVPGWFDDNHPLDTRNFRTFERVTEVIAADAREHFGPQSRPMVRLTVHGLLFNHDMLAFLAAQRGDPVNYLWWYGTEIKETGGPEYILHARNLGHFYPGAHFFENYPAIETEVAEGKLNYALVSEISGPENSAVLIFRRKGSQRPD